MAVLGPPSARVETTAGVAVSGGKLRVYTVNTTTLASVYSDEAMATPLTNPVVADSNGFLPMIFAAEGTYDIAYLTAADVVISGQSYNDFPTYQSGTSSNIERTLSGARVEIDGGDIGDGTTGVRVNMGQPSPTDTGGYGRIGGWNGTQGTKLIVDFATFDVLEPKSLKEDGKRLASVLLTDATSFSAASTVDVALTNDPVGTRAWKITFFDVTVASSTSLDMQLSYDSGATYKSGASDYNWIFYPSGGAATSDDADTKMRAIASTGATAVTSPFILEVTVVTPNSGSGNTLVYGRLIGIYGVGTATGAYIFEALGLGGYGRATHFRFDPGAAVTGSYRVEALRGYGE